MQVRQPLIVKSLRFGRTRRNLFVNRSDSRSQRYRPVQNFSRDGSAAVRSVPHFLRAQVRAGRRNQARRAASKAENLFRSPQYAPPARSSPTRASSAALLVPAPPAGSCIAHVPSAPKYVTTTSKVSFAARVKTPPAHSPLPD